MAVEIKMPQMGESITEGTVVRWFVQPGDHIERDAPLFEISTDKVDTEIPCPQAGWLAQILVHEGDTVPVDTPVCVLAASEEEAAAERAAARTGAGAAAAASARAGTGTGATTGTSLGATSRTGAGAGTGSSLRLSPAVRRLVREHGIDISLISGSGDGNRVTRNDVLAFIERHGGTASTASSPPRAAPVSLSDRVEPMSTMRRKIAEHMIDSRRTSAHVSTVHEADFTEVRALRDQLRPDWQRRGVKLTYLPFLARAVARGLVENPLMNATLVDDEIHYKGDVNLSFAVAIEGGLIVPVLRNVDRLSLEAVAIGINDLATRARSKALKPDDVQGGTFTVTNPGVFGTLIGTPIINQPQAAILCFGAVQKRVMVLDEKNDTIAIRSMAYLSLTFDHRLIDGATADQFLQSVRNTIETADFEVD
jgi:2-oxoglutarate dehydrogenase E2 component (dihydrolipoamide succinyltransferase)